MQKNLVTSFEEACTQLGISSELPDVSTFPENLRKHVIATYKLSKILEVNNGDWKPNIADISQWKYFPWFRIISDGASGFGLSFDGYGYDLALTGLGVRLACANAELAKFMGKTFTDLYKDLLA
jgi:hypothetical protein